MDAARQIGPDGSLRPAVICTLFGLLSATGLRIGEALKLTLADVDLKRRVANDSRDQVQEITLCSTFTFYGAQPIRFFASARESRILYRSPQHLYLSVQKVRCLCTFANHKHFSKHCAETSALDVLKGTRPQTTRLSPYLCGKPTIGMVSAGGGPIGQATLINDLSGSYLYHLH